jgi:hypothetical protein
VLLKQPLAEAYSMLEYCPYYEYLYLSLPLLVPMLPIE